MRALFLLCTFLSSFPLSAMTGKGIERVNFFPDARGFLVAGYEHSELQIETPKEPIKTKEVSNHLNILSLKYNYRFSRKLFAGATVAFERASENSVTYGIPLNQRLHSSGFQSPGLNALYRFRWQKEEKGNLDLHVLYIPAIGRREISESSSTRVAGRNSVHVDLLHGYLEENWEFQNRIIFRYYFDGEESNEVTDMTTNLERYYETGYIFTTQRHLSGDFYLYGSLGVLYRSTEKLRGEDGSLREIRSGTGSQFRLGLKRPFSEWTMLELSGYLRRQEYFVKADEANLEGDANTFGASLLYTVLF